MLDRQRVAGGGFHAEYEAVRRDGGRFPIEVAVAYPRSGDHDWFALAFLRDVSRQREADRLKDEFVSTVSHELRTPLTSIAGSLGLVAGGAAGSLPEKAMRLIGIARANSQRLVRLINDVLDVEKLDAGQLSFHSEPLDLREVAQRAVEGVRGYADSLGVVLMLQDGAPVKVSGDADRLIQVVTNLLSNAAKHSPRGGAVKVTVDQGGASAWLNVADRGPGVPEAFRDRIFSRFAQADSSDARGKSGTGLGLYIARQIAERHGGRLWFEPIPDGGTVFRMEVPALEADVPVGGPRRVLLIEDEPAAAALLSAILEDEGLEVDQAGDLARARAMMAPPVRYGALVLDMRLPDGDGMELVQELRDRPDTRAIPIVVVSGDPSRKGEPSVRALGVTDWMQKPVNPDRLAELVRQTVGKPARGARRILHIDDDRDIREVVAATLASLGEVVPADSLGEARAALAAAPVDLVVLDLELRDGHGLDLLAEIGADTPVVVFTAQDIREVAQLSLELDEAITARTAASAYEALALLESGYAPDVILLDVMMPAMDGPAMVEALDRRSQWRDLPVVYLTARPQQPLDSPRRVLGVIGKPFDPMTLALELRAILSRTRS
ncbi:MAG TPA: response regulator, partial [Caulobacteraceae bacterium]